MDSKQIIYIGNFDNFDTEYDLLVQPSGSTKIRYIISALVEAGYFVSFYSTAICRGNETLKRQKKTYEGYEVNYLFSLGHKGFFNKVLSQVFVYIQLLFLLVRTEQNIPLLVYHSPKLTSFIQKIRFLNKERRLFFEVEEIFSVVRNQELSKKTKEIELLKKANGYILVNDTLKQQCGFISNSVVCYGNYNIPQDKHVQHEKEIVLLVYAGGLDDDAILAIETVRMLPTRYRLYILGYGLKEAIRGVLKRIADVNSEKGIDQVKYMGCLSGDAYSDMLVKCNIGLSTRYVDLESSLYAFPSKILVYLSHGLHIVSTPHRAVNCSKVKEYISFSENFTPESIAKTILAVNTEKIVDSYTIIKSLHDDFVNDLKDFF